MSSLSGEKPRYRYTRHHNNNNSSPSLLPSQYPFHNPPLSHFPLIVQIRKYFRPWAAARREGYRLEKAECLHQRFPVAGMTPSRMMKSGSTLRSHVISVVPTHICSFPILPSRLLVSRSSQSGHPI